MITDRKAYMKLYNSSRREKRTIGMRLWREKNKEKVSEYSKKARSSESYRSYHKKYYKANREIQRDKRRIWARTEDGRQYLKAAHHNRRLKTKDLTKAIIQLVYEKNIKRFGRLTCYLCEIPIEFDKSHLEHKTPLSRGGSNKEENLDVSCSTCNLRKNRMTVEEYLNKNTKTAQFVNKTE